MRSSPSVFLDAPSATLFKLPPYQAALPLPPPTSFDFPFRIPDGLYQGALDPKVPITIAAAYAITVKALNVYNKSTGKKPWAVSNTSAFHWFVVLHNVFLAVYSAWTFVGMLTSLRRSIVSPLGPHGFAGTIDSFCRFNGAPGIGNGATYDETLGRWETVSHDSLDSNGIPSQELTGRLWNDGLAFYGWLFYISKFYEVLDTLIILAKGKLSSTLQTYHHAGAMMCMWAGMCYMSAPIWVFAVFNSFIHALMYTYYTITTFNIKVPGILKRTLTSMQITQFVCGASAAMVHSFIYYTIPVTEPVFDPTTSAAVAEPAASFLGSLKQMLVGAAEAVNGAALLSDTARAPAVAEPIAYETRYETVPCIATPSATFAIWLNVLYLAPLTYLFVSFFIASYLKRSNAEAVRARVEKKAGASEARRLSSAVYNAEKAGWDAARDLEQEVYGEVSEAVMIDDDGTANVFPPGSTRRVLRAPRK